VKNFEILLKVWKKN